MKLETMLFDLDGTLVDSAPDLAFALNAVLLDNNLPEKQFADIRPLVSKGGKALIQFGFGIDESHTNFAIYHQKLLEIYTQNIATHSTLFISRDFLNSLDSWGIVTNKPEYLTHKLLEEIQLRPDVVVCGDTLSENKPSAAPVLFAASKLQHAQMCFVGDDRVDMLAGNRAKQQLDIQTIAVSYGYGIPDESWEYDFLIQTPQQIYDFGKI